MQGNEFSNILTNTDCVRGGERDRVEKALKQRRALPGEASEGRKSAKNTISRVGAKASPPRTAFR